MIHPVNLAFHQGLAQLRIQRFGRLKIVAERLLHHHTPPLSRGFAGQSRCAEMVNNKAEEARSHSHIKQHMVGLVPIFADCNDHPVQPVIGVVFAKIAGEKMHTLQQSRQGVFIKGLRVMFVGRKFTNGFIKMRAEARIIHVELVDANQGKTRGQQACAGEIIEGRGQQAFGQIPAAPENHHGAVGGPITMWRHGVFDIKWHGGQPFLVS